MRLTKNYQVYVNEKPLSLQPMRVSKMPFNRHWPGYQRSLDQTEVTAFASFEITQKITVRIVCDFEFQTVAIKPSSLGIIPELSQRTVTFTLDKPCQTVVEFDGTLGALHLFANPPEQPISLTENDLCFAPGVHEVGRITPKSGQTIYLAEGAVVYGEIYAEDVENVTICGRGILDHSKIQPDTSCEGFIDPPRPSPIEIRYSKNIVLRDIVVRDPCFLAVRPICCEDVCIDNIKIVGCWRYNSDGIDLINCRRGIIKNCFVRTFDDSLCLKGFHFPFQGEMFYKHRTYDTMEDIVFENCVVWNEWGNALHIGIDLCAKEIKNCTFRNCDVIHSCYSVLNISTVDYAEIFDIVYDDIRVEYDDVSQKPLIQESDEDIFVPNPDSTYMPTLFLLKLYQDAYSCGGVKRGKINNVTFRNIQVTAPRMPPSLLLGYSEENAIRGITFEDIYLNGEKSTDADALNLCPEAFVYDVKIK